MKYEGLKKHIGHRIECVEYSGGSVALECKDCDNVIVEKEKPKGDKMTKHKITAKEPFWVTSKLEWDEENEFLVAKDRDIGDVVTPVDNAEYHCSCGKEFEDFSEAERHIKKVKEKEKNLIEKEVINYRKIKESLKLILKDKVPVEKKREILKALDDAISNNWENLVIRTPLEKLILAVDIEALKEEQVEEIKELIQEKFDVSVWEDSIEIPRG